METWQVLIEIVILLAGCLLLGALASWMRQSPLLGYLSAGMFLGGPGSLRLVQAQEHIGAIAELGIALLLFSLGLEFSLPRLRSLGRPILVGGVLQVLLTLAAAAGGGLLLGLPPAAAVTVGAMVALSSTAAVLRLLSERAEMDSSHGRAAVGVLLVQDMAVVPLALMLTLIASGSGAEMLPAAGRLLLLALLFVAGLYLVLDLAAVRILSLLHIQRDRELIILLAAVIGLGSAWAAHQVGLSPSLGAFLAGLFLGTSPFAVQLRADIAPLRVLLLILFFGSAGMVADPVWIASNALPVGAAALAVLSGKAILTTLSLRLSGVGLPAAFGASLVLGQVGEFAFVLGGLGVMMGLLSEPVHQLLISVVIVTLFCSPYLAGLAPALSFRLARWFSPSTAEEPGAQAHGTSVDLIVLGYGPSGRVALDGIDLPADRIMVVDLNARSLKDAQAAGHRTLPGDATQFEVLEHAGIDTARAVLITLPDRATALAALRQARNLNPDAVLVVRARYQQYLPAFRAAGAHVVVGEEEQVGHALADGVRDALGGPQRLGGATS